MTAGAGYLTAQSANSAANKNQASDQLQLYGGMARQAFQQLGADKGREWIAANIPQNIQAQLFGTPAKAAGASPAQQASIDALNKQIQQLSANGGGINAMGRPGQNATQIAALKSQLAALQQQTGAAPAQTGLYDLNAMAAAAGKGIIPQASALGEQQIASQNAGQNQLEGLVQGSRGYGNAMAAQINRDAAQQLARTNAQTDARARASGIFGGSFSANQNAANAGRIFQNKQDALTNLNMGVQDRTLGLQQQAIGQGLQNASNTYNTRMAPLQAQSSLFGSGAFNPYVQSQVPGVSPLGTALGTTGNTLSGLGGTMLGNQQFLAMLKSMGYGSSGSAPAATMSGGAGNAGSVIPIFGATPTGTYA